MSNNCCNQHDQFLLLNCLRTGQDFDTWKFWGSYPDKLEMMEFQNKNEMNKMHHLSELVISGFMKREEGNGIPKGLIPPIYILKLVSNYFCPPVAEYKIIWKYDMDRDPLSTPITTDEDAPEWIENVD